MKTVSLQLGGFPEEILLSEDLPEVMAAFHQGIAAEVLKKLGKPLGEEAPATYTINEGTPIISFYLPDDLADEVATLMGRIVH